MNVRARLRDTILGERRARYLIVAWALAAVAVVLQGAAQQAVGPGTWSAEFLLRWRLYPVTLWAAATPLVLAAARRWPLPAPGWGGHVAVHGVLFSAWMLVSNALLRIPDAVMGDTIGLDREVVAAAIEHAPAGAVLWACLVVVVGLRWSRPGRTSSGPRVHGGAPSLRKDETSSAPEEPSPAERGPVRGAGDRVASPLSLREGHRTYLVPREAVRWVEASGDYLRVHTERRSYRIRGPMKAFQRELGDERFLRIHRSTLVNLSFIREVQPYFHGDYVAILQDGTELRVPRSRRAAIRRLRGD